MINTFTKAVNEEGAEVYVRDWATFNYMIGSMNVVLKVTTALGKNETCLVVTHAETGFKVCNVSWKDVALTRDSENKNNYKAAGRYAAAKKLKNTSETTYKEALERAWEKLKSLS